MELNEGHFTNTNYINGYFIDISPKLAASLNCEWNYDRVVPEVNINGIVTNQIEIELLSKKINTNKSSGIQHIWERIWEKGPIGNFLRHENKFDCREYTLSANHFEIFLIEFEICLYKDLYFLYIRNPLFPIVVFISMLWQLKVNMFYPKNSFPIV